MKKLLLIALPFFPSMAQSLSAQSLDEYKHKQYIKGTDTLLYRILYPVNFHPTNKYPVIFFLHGSGERGNNNTAQLIHGGKLFLKEDVRNTFPAIVIFPQCPKDSYWSNVKISTDQGKRSFSFQKGGEPTKPMELVMGLVKEVRSQKYANNDRIYLGGLSMGGMGTFELLRRKARYFAAAFSICGGDNVANVKKYRKVPLWIFHGAKDDIVDPSLSDLVVRELKRLGAKDIRQIIYPNANHNSWDAAFSEPDLLPWLFSHEK
jgi:predicted peptidase